MLDSRVSQRKPALLSTSRSAPHRRNAGGVSGLFTRAYVGRMGVRSPSVTVSDHGARGLSVAILSPLGTKLRGRCRASGGRTYELDSRETHREILLSDFSWPFMSPALSVCRRINSLTRR